MFFELEHDRDWDWVSNLHLSVHFLSLSSITFQLSPFIIHITFLIFYPSYFSIDLAAIHTYLPSHTPFYTPFSTFSINIGFLLLLNWIDRLSLTIIWWKIAITNSTLAIVLNTLLYNVWFDNFIPSWQALILPHKYWPFVFCQVQWELKLNVTSLTFDNVKTISFR